ncbi:C19orf60 [Bugula neritina]|uniref:C19orf60 n=1 Tax=Bugula neritina TaxID=10212 RepID=A0A7J7K2T5_BUGNE|nr:C19orf60 [Bugula neritina]
MSVTTSVDLINELKRFHYLEAERVETYGLFEEGFRAYLKGAPNYNLQMYKELVNEITTTFLNISKDIIGIKNIFEENGQHAISESVSKIQSLEQKKLQLTADLQIIRQKEIDEPYDALADEIKELKSK